jgi:hypothetical protein
VRGLAHVFRELLDLFGLACVALAPKDLRVAAPVCQHLFKRPGVVAHTSLLRLFT